MLANKIHDTKYEIVIYDWVDLHDDFVCGTVERFDVEPDDSDLHFWMFYPSSNLRRLQAGDLRKLFNFVSKLNNELDGE